MGTAPQVGWAHSVMAWELARYAKSVRLVLPELIDAEAVLSGSGLPATTPAPTGLLNARQRSREPMTKARGGDAPPPRASGSRHRRGGAPLLPHR